MDTARVNVSILVQLVSWPTTKLIHALRFLLSPLLHAIVFVLSPIWILARFLLLPFLHLAKRLFHVITLPLQLKWLERIETIYIYLGTAGLIGCMTGAILYLIFSFLSSSLSIDTASQANPPKRRTTADFRAARRHKQEPTLDPAPPTQPVLDKAPGPRRRGLLSQTIVDEDDSDF
ncbi:uncharacterized protein EKO05_0003004 [Ascochyta rabiei]|uniref:Uncharacterized protein n=1 Tax=Didymella rabiei TaxID=5454 RepID=A0A162XEQ5_DIDRA|nr:uncharacterized protein EKO05_0003004 [Ascochyta rabiei]KZM19505.1 hypothetical protein ST47_g9428 [Ascochyta rabiei]UPX12458.1 hypothetical protein EKO05_0003004 [Ascochyta rabiei]